MTPIQSSSYEGTVTGVPFWSLGPCHVRFAHVSERKAHGQRSAAATQIRSNNGGRMRGSTSVDRLGVQPVDDRADDEPRGDTDNPGAESRHVVGSVGVFEYRDGRTCSDQRPDQHPIEWRIDRVDPRNRVGRERSVPRGVPEPEQRRSPFGVDDQ